MTPEPIFPFNYNTQVADQRAARHGLDFCIDEYNYYVEYRGWKSENRPATDAELVMWSLLNGDLSKAPEAETAEVYDSLEFLKGYVYINAADFAAIRRRKNGFSHSNDRIKEGIYGTLAPTYEGQTGMAFICVSRYIPPGCYFQSDKQVDELHWELSPEAKAPRPDLSKSLRQKMEFEMKVYKKEPSGSH